MSKEREIQADLLHVGQSFSLFPQNAKADVVTVIDAFGWPADKLLANEPISQYI